MRTTLITCDICGTEQPRDLHWSVATVRCNANFARDGVNGGDFSGDWCWKCRNIIHNIILLLKGEEIPAEYNHIDFPCGGE